MDKQRWIDWHNDREFGLPVRVSQKRFSFFLQRLDGSLVVWVLRELASFHHHGPCSWAFQLDIVAYETAVQNNQRLNRPRFQKLFQFLRRFAAETGNFRIKQTKPCSLLSGLSFGQRTSGLAASQFTSLPCLTIARIVR